MLHNFFVKTQRVHIHKFRKKKKKKKGMTKQTQIRFNRYPRLRAGACIKTAESNILQL